MPKCGEDIEVVIQKVVFGGQGLARHGEGFVILVPFAAEEDRLRVRITERKAHHARAGILDILEGGRGRETAPCPYYGECGGCQYQHLTYAEECRLKENQVREAFARIGKLPEAPIRPVIASPEAYGYRNRITVHAAEGRIGFRSTDGRRLVDIDACLIARPEVNEELARLRLSHPPEGHYSLRDGTVPRSGFAQANHDLRETLRGLVAEALPAKGKVLLEGYCGGGFFTGAVAERFERIVAIDNDARTLRDARRLNLAQVSWREADVAEALPRELAEVEADSCTILLDPPREGLAVSLAGALCGHAVERLVYVSCNPATLARDARILSSRYHLLSVQPIDLFPRTAQIECVTVWDRIV